MGRYIDKSLEVAAHIMKAAPRRRSGTWSVSCFLISQGKKLGPWTNRSVRVMYGALGRGHVIEEAWCLDVTFVLGTNIFMQTNVITEMLLTFISLFVASYLIIFDKYKFRCLYMKNRYKDNEVKTFIRRSTSLIILSK